MLHGQIDAQQKALSLQVLARYTCGLIQFLWMEMLKEFFHGYFLFMEIIKNSIKKLNKL